MKGKKILTLASVALGVGIVGATFGAWAVTDNADPFGIKITPGTIKDDEVKTVTLSYGKSTFANVENLEGGKAKLAGSVVLKAETSDGLEYKKGHFDLELKEEESNGGAETLLKHLTVKVYDAAPTVNEETGVATAPEGAQHLIGTIPVSGDTPYKTTIEINVPSGDTGVQVWITVELEADLKPAVLDVISTDIVKLNMDWNKNSEAVLTSAPVFVKKSGLTGDVYCYAWNASGKNAAYPGMKMENVGSGLYEYQLGAEYTSVIFSTLDETTLKTSDLTLPSGWTGEAGLPMYDVDAKQWKAAPNLDLTHDYFVTSATKGNWAPNDTYGMTKVDGTEEDPEHYASGVLTMTAGEAIKCVNKTSTVWYSSVTPWDGCGFTIDEEGNVKVTEAGNYIVKLYLDGSGGNCVVLSKQAAQG